MRAIQREVLSVTTVESGSTPQTLIFLHIPKTAGVTLRRIIDRQYDKSTIFTFGGPNALPGVNSPPL